MSGFLKSRRFLVGAVLLALGVSFGLQARGADPISATGPSTAPAPKLPEDPNKPIATIGNIPIDNQKFYGLLMQSFGVRVFLQAYDLVLVQHAMTLAGIPTEGEDWNKRIQHELDLMLDSMPGKDLSREDKGRELQALINQQGLTQPEFLMRLQTKAGLRAMAEGKIEVTPEEAKAAWQAEFGPRRTIHLIGVTGSDQAAQVRDEIMKKGKTPDEAAKDLGLPAPTQWVISENATGIGDVQKVTFGLTKEKDLSAMMELPAAAGQTPQKALIYLDKIEGDRTKENPYVEKDVIARVHAAKEEQWMNQHLQTLRADPTVKTVINDPYLAAEFANIQRSQQAAGATGTAPATMPATAPATAPAAPHNMPPMH